MDYIDIKAILSGRLPSEASSLSTRDQQFLAALRIIPEIEHTNIRGITVSDFALASFDLTPAVVIGENDTSALMKKLAAGDPFYDGQAFARLIDALPEHVGIDFRKYEQMRQLAMQAVAKVEEKGLSEEERYAWLRLGLIYNNAEGFSRSHFTRIIGGAAHEARETQLLALTQKDENTEKFQAALEQAFQTEKAWRNSNGNWNDFAKAYYAGTQKTPLMYDDIAEALEKYLSVTIGHHVQQHTRSPAPEDVSENKPKRIYRAAAAKLDSFLAEVENNYAAAVETAKGPRGDDDDVRPEFLRAVIEDEERVRRGDIERG